MTREEAEKEIRDVFTEVWGDKIIKALKQEPCEDAGWIPVKWHEITDEERKQNEYPKEWAVYLDCIMPDDEQEILTTTKGGYIEFDTCFHDGCGYSLDSARDWIADITAWMPLPKPYKESEG